MSSFHPCDRFCGAVDGGERDQETRKGRDLRLENLISSNPCLQLITSHLFHRGFTTEFLSTLLQSLVKDQSVTGVSPLQALLRSDKKLLQVMPLLLGDHCSNGTAMSKVCDHARSADDPRQPHRLQHPLSPIPFSHSFVVRRTARRHYLPSD